MQTTHLEYSGSNPLCFKSRVTSQDIEAAAPFLCVPLVCHADMDKLHLFVYFPIRVSYFTDSSGKVHCSWMVASTRALLSQSEADSSLQASASELSDFIMPLL